MTPPGRLTVVETVYHQEPGQQPTALTTRYGRPLETAEQPFTRRLRLGDAWQPLPAGWLDAAALLHLVNEEGRQLTRQPTPADRQALAGRVVEVGVLPPGHWGLSAETAVAPVVCWLVRPGESLRAEPAALAALVLRCRQESARVTLTLLPR